MAKRAFENGKPESDIITTYKNRKNILVVRTYSVLVIVQTELADVLKVQPCMRQTDPNFQSLSSPTTSYPLSNGRVQKLLPLLPDVMARRFVSSTT